MPRKLLYTLLVITVVFAACSKKKDPPGAQSIIFNAMVNGKTWSLSEANVKLKQNGGYQISILVDSGKKNMSLFINNFVGVGVYPIVSGVGSQDHPNSAYVSTIDAHGDTAYSYSGSGVIVIQNNYKFNNVLNGLQGYFVFNADTFSVTNGYFNVILPLRL